MKNLLLKVEDNVYFKLTELKGKWQVDSWEALLDKLIEYAEAKQ